MTKRVGFIVLLLLGASRAWSQTPGVGPPAAASDLMEVPPPVSINGDSLAFTSELEKSNYLRGGLNVQGAYDDNIFTRTPAESDASYTISPTIEFDMVRSRLRWDLNYSPGFTLYQKFTSEDQVDHIFSTNLEYKMSPHVTLTLQDNLAKTPSFSGLLQPETTLGVSNALPSQTLLVVPPLVNTLTNNDGGQVTYQFARNAMVGLGGSSSELYFLGEPQNGGLSDSSEYGAQGFYTYRFGVKNYVGANYGFEDIMTHPAAVETQVQSATFFYTFYLGRRISFSSFGGAQYTNTQGGMQPSFSGWSPTEGGEINWQGLHNSVALNISQSVSAGGGLEGAIHSYGGDAKYRHQFTEHLTGSLQISYAKTNVLQPAGVPGLNGNLLMFGGSLQRFFGRNFSAELGYSRIDQHYKSIPAVSNNADVDRGWITLSYRFERPLGR